MAEQFNKSGDRKRGVKKDGGGKRGDRKRGSAPNATIVHYAPYDLPVCEKDTTQTDVLAEGSFAWMTLVRRPGAIVCLACFDCLMSVTKASGGEDGGRI